MVGHANVNRIIHAIHERALAPHHTALHSTMPSAAAGETGLCIMHRLCAPARLLRARNPELVQRAQRHSVPIRPLRLVEAAIATRALGCRGHVSAVFSSNHNSQRVAMGMDVDATRLPPEQGVPMSWNKQCKVHLYSVVLVAVEGGIAGDPGARQRPVSAVCRRRRRWQRGLGRWRTRLGRRWPPERWWRAF